MTSTQIRIGVGVLVGAAVAVAVGLTVWLTRGDDAPSTLSHTQYMRLFARAVPGETTTAVLENWPKPPYQDYHDGSRNHCYEWIDRSIPLRSVRLYDLCFKSGKLVSKSLA
jgi:hypothetical protein